jgi:hypothetical protein
MELITGDEKTRVTTGAERKKDQL